MGGTTLECLSGSRGEGTDALCSQKYLRQSRPTPLANPHTFNKSALETLTIVSDRVELGRFVNAGLPGVKRPRSLPR